MPPPSATGAPALPVRSPRALLERVRSHVPRAAAPNGRQARRVGPRRGRTGAGHRSAAGPPALLAALRDRGGVGRRGRDGVAGLGRRRARDAPRRGLAPGPRPALADQAPEAETVDAELRTYGEYERYALLAREQARDALSAAAKRAPTPVGLGCRQRGAGAVALRPAAAGRATSRAPVTRTTSRRRLPGPSPATRISRASSRTPGGPRRTTSAAAACT